MIPLTQALDLGADRTRMKDPHDIERQNATARALLARLYDEAAPGFMELQLLADEVGMGKTFVALAVAYSLLEAQQAGQALTDCYQKVLVLVPQNEELLRKWEREVGELVKRCARQEHQEVAKGFFEAERVERPDDLVRALRRGRKRIIVAKTSALGARVKDEDPKARVTLAALFKHFGRALPLETRRILLKGAPAWPAEPADLAALSEAEEECLPFAPFRIGNAVRDAAAGDGGGAAESILELCREWGAPHVRRRPEGFKALRRKALEFYKDAIWGMLGRDLPLVIVDEAHQWKNKQNGFRTFAERIAPRTRRALLLTATPFQLCPEEILLLLEVSDHLGIGEERCERLKALRERAIRPALERSRTEGMAFTKKWSSMGARLDPAALRETWECAALGRARKELATLARSHGAVEEHAVEQIVRAARLHVPPELRDFVCQALRLFAFNRDLGDELGRFVVRHRRSTRHRVFRAGHEIDLDVATLKERPGAHVLHPAPGIEVGGDDELPLYLLMRATSELEQGRRTANLGSSLTGCYSTFFKSAASAAFAKVDEVGKAVGLGGARGASGAGASGTGDAATYVGLLRELVGDPRADETHPKMRRVVREIADRWERGEKSLVFTFRVNTAERLHALLDAEIEQRLASKTRAIFWGERGIAGLRKRLGSTRDALYQTLLDRVLWSMLWAPPDREPPSISAAELRPTGDDYREVARLSLAFGEDILGSAPDRVFLHRAAECALARRLKDRAPRGSRCRQVLDLMADETWVERAYGDHGAEDAGEEAAVHGDADAAPWTPDEDGMGREAWNRDEVELAGDAGRRGEENDGGEARLPGELADEKGVHSVYRRVRRPTEGEVERLAKELVDRDGRLYRAKRVGAVRQAFVGPSFWLGAEPEVELLRREHHPANVEVDRSDQRFLHIHLGELTWGSGGARPDFRTRAMAFQAMRRAMLRESILVRLLPSLDETDLEAWGKVLVRHFASPRRGQDESMLRLVGVFIEDLAAASGDIWVRRSARGALYEAGMRNRSAVDIVKGDTKSDTRSARFQGFNTPLLPEILVCGQVAQEGIDLHRHCSHVVHYDLAWNPATLEQRTGRVDRIGSRTQRLRQLGTGEDTDSVEPGTIDRSGRQDAVLGAPDARLEIDTPYLAGTYDERMFEELRIRAQTFEVLLGGELSGAGEGAPAARSDGAATDGNGSYDSEGDERAARLVALPDSVADSLRVDLAIWRAPASTAHDG